MTRPADVRIDDLAEPRFSPEIVEVRRMLADLASTIEMTPERIIADATGQTGLTDLGDDWFREPLERLCQSVRIEANLSAPGLANVYLMLVGSMRNRLLIEQVKKERFAVGRKVRSPEAASVPEAGNASQLADAERPVPSPPPDATHPRDAAPAVAIPSGSAAGIETPIASTPPSPELTPPSLAPAPATAATEVASSPNAAGVSAAAPENGRDDSDRASRHIPDAIKRAVFERDGGRCTYVDPATGRRCTATAWLEYNHDEGFAFTGQHDAASIHLLCRNHNRYEAKRMFGRAFMDDVVRARRHANAAMPSTEGTAQGETAETDLNAEAETDVKAEAETDVKAEAQIERKAEAMPVTASQSDVTFAPVSGKPPISASSS